MARPGPSLARASGSTRCGPTTAASRSAAGMGYGSDYADLVDQLVDCDPGDTTARLALQFQMAASLLERNYTLSDRDLRRLLAIDLADPECEPRWAQINQVLLGRPPKPSADGSATPSSPTGSPGN